MKQRFSIDRILGVSYYLFLNKLEIVGLEIIIEGLLGIIAGPVDSSTLDLTRSIII